LDEESGAATFILKVYRDFKEIMVEVNIWKAFAAIVFTYDIGQILYGLLFDKEKFRQNPGFVEFWERDISFENLSKRLRESKFKWINKSAWIDLIEIRCYFDN
jgi:hypothetical protein